jgi:predicted secreted hydrolase
MSQHEQAGLGAVPIAPHMASPQATSPARRQWLQDALQKAAEAGSAALASSRMLGHGGLVGPAAQGLWGPSAAGLAACAMASDPAQAMSPVRELPPVIPPGEPIVFPRDFGAHPALRTEWWYITGSLWPTQGSAGAGAKATGDAQPAPTLGFQITFFRSRVDTAQASNSRFAAKQLVFAHTALTDLGRQELVHDQRIARTGFGLAEASERDTDITLRDWRLQRTGPVTQSQYRSHIAARAFTLDLRFDQTQPVLLQGDAGFSRKGPQLAQASHYYSQPQLRVQGQVRYRQQDMAMQGQAWLDHEWSESLLDADAVGWDWIGMNLLDGSALTAFRLRRHDGRTLFSGGSLRRPGQASRSFNDGEVRFTPGRVWASPATGARYPVQWTVEIPGARFEVRARIDNQELDSRGSTGSVYWEGLSTLLDAQGQVIGNGYLEMTGYAAAMQL